MDYACKAGVYNGIARCRNLTPCSVHSDGAPPAPRPDIVLLKVNLNKKWERRFAEAGVAKLERSPARASELAEQHVAQATKLDRHPFTIRREIDSPESADSGCPVFGKSGLQDVGIRNLVSELERKEFRLTGKPHQLSRGWKPPVRLVLEFSLKGTPAKDFPWQLFQQLITTCFGQVDVWANPAGADGRVPHTVNCGKRDDGAKPIHALHYANGDWFAAENH